MSALHLSTTRHAGDTVSVQLCVSARSGKLRVCKVRLVRRALESRERGVVVGLQPSSGFGFLRSEARESAVFFPFSQLPEGAPQPPRVGDPV